MTEIDTPTPETSTADSQKTKLPLNIPPIGWLILANTATLMNVLSGLAGVYFALEGNVLTAYQMLLLGAFFDLIDGKMAKMSGIKFPPGVYADSFADLITFAILPGYIVLAEDGILWLSDLTLVTVPFLNAISVGHVVAAAYALGGWYRLVRFSSKPLGVWFEGLPSAAAAMLVGALAVLVSSFDDLNLPLDVVLTLTTGVCAILMVSWLTYPSPKRMLASDNILISVAGVIGFFYVVFPNVISAFLVLFISVLYTVAGPYYYIKTKRLVEEAGKAEVEESSTKN